MKTKKFLIPLIAALLLIGVGGITSVIYLQNRHYSTKSFSPIAPETSKIKHANLAPKTERRPQRTKLAIVNPRDRSRFPSVTELTENLLGLLQAKNDEERLNHLRELRVTISEPIFYQTLEKLKKKYGQKFPSTRQHNWELFEKLLNAWIAENRQEASTWLRECANLSEQLPPAARNIINRVFPRVITTMCWNWLQRDRSACLDYMEDASWSDRWRNGRFETLIALDSAPEETMKNMIKRIQKRSSNVSASRDLRQWASLWASKEPYTAVEWLKKNLDSKNGSELLAFVSTQLGEKAPAVAEAICKSLEGNDFWVAYNGHLATLDQVRLKEAIAELLMYDETLPDIILDTLVKAYAQDEEIADLILKGDVLPKHKKCVLLALGKKIGSSSDSPDLSLLDALMGDERQMFAEGLIRGLSSTNPQEALRLLSKEFTEADVNHKLLKDCIYMMWGQQDTRAALAGARNNNDPEAFITALCGSRDTELLLTYQAVIPLQILKAHARFLYWQKDDKEAYQEFVDSLPEKMREYASKWVDQSPKQDGESLQNLKKQRQLAQAKMNEDRKVYPWDELKYIESLYYLASAQTYSDKGKKLNLLRKIVERGGCSNRQGCATLYLARNVSDKDESKKLLRQAMTKYNNCYYGDGVRVGAVARWILAKEYQKEGKTEEANELIQDIRKNYPDCVYHNGKRIIDCIDQETSQ